MRLLLPAVILSVALILSPILWFSLTRIGGDGQVSGSGSGMAIDSGARIEIERLSQQIEAMQARIDELSGTLRNVASRPAPTAPTMVAPQPQSGALQPPLQPDGSNAILDSYAQVVLIANRSDVNDGLTIAGPSYLARTFGLPREQLDDKCRDMTNPRLASKLVRADVGPITVYMLQPAVDSLRRVFENVRVTDPDLYARINTAGSLCVRLIRGSRNSASTHSYGLAVDLNIDGHLDTLGDGRTQLGLTILADFFKQEGWVWGASWRREDSMHFEVSRQKLEEWIEAGIL